MATQRMLWYNLVKIIQMGIQGGNKHQSTKFITGLRGYSVLAVFLIHGGSFIAEFSHFAHEVVSWARFGVISFFVISSFTIAMSLDSNIRKNKHTFLSYLRSRFFRIFPLFFVVALFAFIKGGASYYLEMFSVQNDVSNFIIQMSLLNIFFVKHQNNLIGVEWSLSVEFFYYLLFPAMFYLFKQSFLKTTLMVLVSFFISYYSFHVNYILFYSEGVTTWLSNFEFGRYFVTELFDPRHFSLSSNWGTLLYLFTFSSGMYIYKIFKNRKFQCFLSKLSERTSSALLLLVLVGGFLIALQVKDEPEIAVTIYTCLVLLACFHRGKMVRIIFENPVIMHVGNISYSFYLIHMLILESIKIQTPVIQFITALIATIAISTLTYYFIEKPFIRLGHKVKIRSTPLLS